MGKSSKKEPCNVFNAIPMYFSRDVPYEYGCVSHRTKGCLEDLNILWRQSADLTPNRDSSRGSNSD